MQSYQRIYRINYYDWADLGETSIYNLSNLITIIQRYLLLYGGIPIVHCRVGVGRTGTLLTSMAIGNLFRKGKIINLADLVHAIHETILQGRVQRGTGFMQTEGQLQIVLEYGEQLLMAIPEDLTHQVMCELGINAGVKRLAEENKEEGSERNTKRKVDKPPELDFKSSPRKDVTKEEELD